MFLLDNRHHIYYYIGWLAKQRRSIFKNVILINMPRELPPRQRTETDMNHYKMTIAGLERALPLCPITDDLYIGAFVTFGDPELVTACAEELLKRAPEFDYMLTAESKGIPITHEMARLAGNKRYFLARKTPKLYMTGVFEVDVRSITTAKAQKLYLDKAEADMIRGKRILIVDDVVSTGESEAALEKLVTAAGGEICGRMCILAEGEAAERDDLIYLEKLPLFNKNGDVIED